MRDYPAFEDLGLIDDDNTEILTKRTAPEPQVRQHLAGTAHTHKSSEESR
ncbi:hypothetical protein [Mycolicibacterium sp. 624]